MKMKIQKELKSNVLTYKGYYGSIEFCLEDNYLYGSLIGMEKGAMTYEGVTLNELTARFKETVDIYLEHCQECGIEPQIPFSGLLNISLSPSLHNMIMFKAKEKGISVNLYIKQALEHELQLGISV